MNPHNHYEGIGIFGSILGFLSYLIGHAVQFLPSVEQTIPAVILACICSFAGGVVAVFTKWLSKRLFK